MKQLEGHDRRPARRLGIGVTAVAAGVLVLVAGIGRAGPAHGDGTTKRTRTAPAQITAALGLSGGALVQLDLDPAPRPARRVPVEIDGRPLVLDLRRHSVRTHDFVLRRARADGRVVAVPAPPVRTMRGTVRGDAGGRVRASVLEDGLHARVDLPDGRTFWIEPAAGHAEDAAPGTHVVYADDDVLPVEGGCGTAPGIAREGAGFQLPGGSPADGGGGEELFRTEIALDVDSVYLDRFGEGAVARVETIINTMNEQYRRDVQIEHLIGTIIVRETLTYTTDDPFELIDQFRDQWLAFHRDVDRDIAHLFTGRDMLGSVIGIAQVGVICDSVEDGRGFGLVQDFGSLGCRTDLSAHELGHNWSAGHCDPCETTMRSFIGCFNVFGPGTIGAIASHRDSRTCLERGPLNDDCVDAFAVGDGVYGFDTTFASNDGPALPEACREDGSTSFSKDIWYTYTASCDGIATASTCDAEYNSRLAVYATVACPPETVVACNDDACGDEGTRATVDFPVTAGTEYMVRVGGRQAAGPGTLVLSCVEGVPCDGDIDGSGTVDTADLVSLLAAWGSCPGCREDLDDDGTVDTADLLILLGHWGPCP